MSREIGICKGCETPKSLIVNKTRYFCLSCNNDRNSAQKTQPLQPKVSKEQKQKVAYQKFDLLTPHVCAGCGSTKSLSHSHIIPRSIDSTLEDNIENMTFHCLIGLNNSEGCHSKWESNNWEKMSSLLDFEQRLDYIKKNNERYHNSLMQLKEKWLKKKL